MEGTTLTRPSPGTDDPRPRPSSGERGDRLAKLVFALLCLGFLIGFFVFPTYPVYDSYYSLLWGRDLLARRRAGLRRLPLPDPAPADDRRRLLPAVLRRVGGPAVGGADPRLLPGAGRGRLPARQDRRHAARGRDRRRAAADPLRLPVPGRPRLSRHPLHGADRVGRDPRVAAPAARDLRARPALAGGDAAARGVVPGGDVLVLGGVEGDLARALHLRRAGRERPAGVVHGRLRGHGRPDVLAELHVGLGGGSRPPAAALRAAGGGPAVLREPGQAAGLPGRRRRAPC